MTEKIPRIRKILFYMALTIELLLVIVDKSAVTNPYVSYFFRVTFLLTLAVVLLSQYTRREWIVLLVLTAISVVSYRLSGRNEMLRFTMFIAACREIDIPRALRYSFLVTLGGCLVIVLLSVTGILGSISLTQDYGRSDGVITRYTFGFGHPNSLQCMFFMLMLLGMYLYAQRMKWYTYLILLIANYGIYYLTDSRTGFIVATGAIILAAAMRADVFRMHVWPYAGGILMMGGCVGFSVWAAANSKDCWQPDKLVDKIDHMLNGRIVQLYWGTKAQAGAINTWHLFSSHASEEYFDMGWVRLFYWYGWIPALIAIAVLVLFLAACARKHDGAALMLVVSMSVYTVVEAHLVSEYIGRNFLLLLIGAYFASMLHAEGGTKWGILQKGSVNESAK